jgi:hypothetical protein
VFPDDSICFSGFALSLFWFFLSHMIALTWNSFNAASAALRNHLKW